MSSTDDKDCIVLAPETSPRRPPLSSSLKRFRLHCRQQLSRWRLRRARQQLLRAEVTGDAVYCPKMEAVPLCRAGDDDQEKDAETESLGSQYWPVVTNTDRWWPILTGGYQYWPVVTSTDGWLPILTAGDKYWPLALNTARWCPILTTGSQYSSVVFDSKSGHPNIDHCQKIFTLNSQLNDR